ncbi:glycosyltransferase [Selenomonas ruminantium]|uniref:glycosyltransferase n=1 Tax=Selenomonas ruminantium TaxID=971 RepID=UPI0015699EFF|nr:glycosyltransferase [Selenomonas ruminantium]
MKELIYVTGKINFPFFINEIVVMRKYFDSVYVLSYGDEDKLECDKLADKYKFNYDFILEKQLSFDNFKMLCCNLLNKNIIEEMSFLKKTGRLNLKNIAYMYYYEWFSLIMGKYVTKRISKNKEIYLYSFWLSRPAFAIAKFNENRRGNIKQIISRTHRYDLYEEENSFNYLPFRRYIDRNLDRIYFSSRDSLKYYQEKNYSCEGHAEYCLSYLGTRNFNIRKQYNINKEEIVFASCSNMIQRKRLDLIVSLLASPSLRDIKKKWICIGDGELFEEIKDMARLYLDETEVFFTGRVSEEEIYKIYKEHDVDFFVNMSDSEGVPVSIMEALSMGIPCVARNVGGNADIVNDKNGFLIEKEKVSSKELDDLAKKIVDKFMQKDQYFKMMNNAFDLWNERFNTEHNVKNFCESLIANQENT